MPNIETILRDHVALQIECIDRLYLNGYLPRLQTEGGLVAFLRGDPEKPIPSPALLGQRTKRFVGDIERYARDNRVRVVRFERGQRKEERAANYRYSMSILQMEVSRTEVFDRPLAGRQFFEEVIRENLDLGRPDRVQLIFNRRINRRTPGSFRTRVLTAGVEPALRVNYKNTTIKQYFKRGRALRTETTFNNTRDFGVGKSIINLERLRSIGRNANRRLLNIERLSHNCAVASTSFERVVLPTASEDGVRAPGLRFGDPRVMALFSGLACQAHQPDGFSNAMLRERVAALHDKTLEEYTRSRMTYDLRRLRLKALIQRIPGRHRYVLTPLGRRIALFCSKAYVRVLRGGLSRLDAPPAQTATDPLVLAWNRLDRALDETVAVAKLIA